MHAAGTTCRTTKYSVAPASRRDTLLRLRMIMSVRVSVYVGEITAQNLFGCQSERRARQAVTDTVANTDAITAADGADSDTDAAVTAVAIADATATANTDAAAAADGADSCTAADRRHRQNRRAIATVAAPATTAATVIHAPSPAVRTFNRTVRR